MDDVEERGVGEDCLNLCWEHLNGYGDAREGGSELYYVLYNPRRAQSDKYRAGEIEEDDSLEEGRDHKIGRGWSP